MARFDKNQSAIDMLNAIREEIGSRSLRRRSTNDDLGAVTISVGFAERRPGELAPFRD